MKEKPSIYTKDPPICSNCKKQMQPAWDKIEQKISKYSWYCLCTPNKRLSKG